MSLPKPTIVIFDMDGTSVRHINIYLLHVLEKLDDWSYAITKFFKWLIRHEKNEPIIAADDEFLNRKKPRLFVHRAMHHLRRKEVDQIVEPCPGIYSVLSFLQKKKIPMGLASNGLGKGYGHDVLATFDLERFFKATIFREDIQQAKPHPEGILTALKRMAVEISDKDVVWYIGDRHKDITAALAADKHTPANIIPIAYGVNASVAVIEKGLGPEHICMSYTDMYDNLRALFN